MVRWFQKAVAPFGCGVAWFLALGFSSFVKSAEANHVVMHGGPFLGVLLSIAVDPVDSRQLYCAAFGGGVFRSSDRGKTWIAINRGLPNRKVLHLLIDNRKSTRIYAGSDQGIFTSFDRGNSWRLLSPDLKERNVRFLALDAIRSGVLYAATDKGVFRGEGERWKKFSEGLGNSDVRTLVTSSDGTIYAGTFGGIFQRRPGHAWRVLNNGLANKEVRALAIDPQSSSTLYAGTARGGVFKTTNGGEDWQPANRGLLNSTILALTVSPSPVAAVYAGTVDGVYKSLDGGSQWNPTGEQLAFTVPALTFDPSQPRLLYAGSGGHLYRSRNAGRDWEELSHDVNYFGPASLSTQK